MTSGETDLSLMLRTLEPVLDLRRFTFSTDPNMTMAEGAQLSPVAMFQEAEGLTLIREGGDGPYFSMISLSVHSSLEAVGLTAAFSRALGDCGISANVVAAYFHDHIFVQESDAEQAMRALRDLAKSESAISDERE